jgi:hypothetical protein
MLTSLLIIPIIGVIGIFLGGSTVALLLAIVLQCFAVHIFDFMISNYTVFCEGITDGPTAALPQILEFGNLHCTDTFKAMITALKGVAGVYAIIHTASGKAYIGSTQNIGLRLMSHLVYGSCNSHLQNARYMGYQRL